MVVDLAGQEVADHEVPALEDLVHRRRLVHLAGDRHVVVDVERVGVEAAVPADDVEGVRRVGHPGADDAGAGAVLDQHVDVGDVAVARHQRVEVGGAVQVALAVRRVLEELPEARQVALGRVDVAVGLDGVEPARLGGHPAVGGRARDHDVVAGAVGHDAEDGLDGAGAVLDVDALVADGVAVERRGVGAGEDVGDPDVVVAEDQAATLDRAGAGLEVVQPQVARLERVVGRARLVGELPRPAVDERRRHAVVVEQGGVGGEALLPHQLLEVESALGIAVLGVPLRRDGSRAPVVRHRPRPVCEIRPINGRVRPLCA